MKSNLYTKLMAVAILAFGALAFQSCDSDDPEDPHTLSAERYTLNFDATDAAEQTIEIATNVAKWLADRGEHTWITVTQDGNKLGVKVGNNTSDEKRTGTITLTAGNAEAKTITVNQSGLSDPPAGKVTLSPPSLNFTSAAAEETVTVTTDADDFTPEVTVGTDWLSVEKINTGSFKAKATANDAANAEKRTGTIKVTDANNQTATLTVTQLAGDAKLKFTFTPDKLEVPRQGVEEEIIEVEWEGTGFVLDVPEEYEDWITAAPVSNTSFKVTVLPNNVKDAPKREGKVKVSGSGAEDAYLTIEQEEYALLYTLECTVKNQAGTVIDEIRWSAFPPVLGETDDCTITVNSMAPRFYHNIIWHDQPGTWVSVVREKDTDLVFTVKRGVGNQTGQDQSCTIQILADFAEAVEVEYYIYRNYTILIDTETTKSIGYEGGDLRFAVDPDLDGLTGDITAGAAWMNTVVRDGQLIVSVNENSGSYREGTIVIRDPKQRAKDATVYVKQDSKPGNVYTDIVGSWTLTALTDDGTDREAVLPNRVIDIKWNANRQWYEVSNFADNTNYFVFTKQGNDYIFENKKQLDYTVVGLTGNITVYNYMYTYTSPNRSISSLSPSNKLSVTIDVSDDFNTITVPEQLDGEYLTITAGYYMAGPIGGGNYMVAAPTNVKYYGLIFTRVE